VGYVALERSVQSWLFSGQRLAQTYRPDQITHPFPFNAFYPQYNAPEVDLFDYRLEVSGKVEKKRRGRWNSYSVCRNRARSPG
jgi:DMSO/TMAO reductase YedYZ molybdopterin-dependent catalytic subunit